MPLPSAMTTALGKTGQNYAKPAQVPDLPSAWSKALGKTEHFAECHGDVRRAVSVRSTFLCQVLMWYSAKALPSARYIALGKEPFADKSYAGGSLPSVTLGKLFAECKLGFAECLGHSAKNPCPVVVESYVV